MNEPDTTKIIKEFSKNICERNNITKIKDKIDNKILNDEQEIHLNTIVKENIILKKNLTNETSINNIEKSLIEYQETLKNSILDLSVNDPNINENDIRNSLINFKNDEIEISEISDNIINENKIINEFIKEYKNIGNDLDDLKYLKTDKSIISSNNNNSYNNIESELNEIQKGIQSIKQQERKISGMVNDMNKDILSFYNNPTSSLTIDSVKTSSIFKPTKRESNINSVNIIQYIRENSLVISVVGICVTTVIITGFFMSKKKSKEIRKVIL